MSTLKLSNAYGIHTIELYLRDLKYNEVQKVIDRLENCGRIQKIKSDPYNIDRHLKSQYLVENGIRMRIYQSHNKSNGIGFAVNPSTLLSGEYQPVKLWVPKKNSVDQLLKRLSDILEDLGLEPSYAEKVSLSQIDITLNRWAKNGCDVTPTIHRFRKGLDIRYFHVHPNKDKSLNPYLCIRKNKQVSLKVYDKIHELKEYNRCPESLKDKSILRVEVSLKRKAFLKKFNLAKEASLYDILCAGYLNGKDLIDNYLEKIDSFSGKSVHYKDAVKLVETSVKDPDLQAQMLYLLKKTSDSAGLSAAVRKLKDCYKNVNDRRIEKIFAEFNKLGICPVTRPKG